MPATCSTGGLGNWAGTHIEQLKAAGVRNVSVIPDREFALQEVLTQTTLSWRTHGRTI